MTRTSDQRTAFICQLKLRSCIMFDSDRAAKLAVVVDQHSLDLEALKLCTERPLRVDVMPGKFTFAASIDPGGIKFSGDKTYQVRFTIPASEVAHVVKFLSYTDKPLKFVLSAADDQVPQRAE